MTKSFCDEQWKKAPASRRLPSFVLPYLLPDSPYPLVIMWNFLLLVGSNLRRGNGKDALKVENFPCYSLAKSGSTKTVGDLIIHGKSVGASLFQRILAYLQRLATYPHYIDLFVHMLSMYV